ncbi:hypothetical protein [Nocardia crassostreae]|uniref:hypothetical protein n=1 Tax=Nocardia crassostreae TaxID=53428 RepID=UPI000B289A2D|nr:hypothetical protein [Nocardia crassostreae]
MTSTAVGPGAGVGTDDRPQAHLGLTLLALCAAGLVVSLQQTVVIPLLPRMIGQLHTDVSGVTWLFTAALLTGAVSTPCCRDSATCTARRRWSWWPWGC